MQSLEAKPLLLDVHRITLRLTPDEFEKLCQDNRDRSFELTASGELIVMPPIGGESGNYESELGINLGIWNRQTKLGKTFSSSTIFVLPMKWTARFFSPLQWTLFAPPGDSSPGGAKRS